MTEAQKYDRDVDQALQRVTDLLDEVNTWTRQYGLTANPAELEKIRTLVDELSDKTRAN